MVGEIFQAVRLALFGGLAVVVVLEIILLVVRKRSIHAFGAWLAFLVAVAIWARWINYGTSSDEVVLLVGRLQYSVLLIFAGTIPTALRFGLKHPPERLTWAVLLLGHLSACLVWFDGPILVNDVVTITEATGVVAKAIVPSSTSFIFIVLVLGGLAIELFRLIRTDFDIGERAWRGLIVSLLIFSATALNDVLQVATGFTTVGLVDIGIGSTLLFLVAIVAANAANVFTELEEDVAQKTSQLAGSVESLRQLISGLPDMIFILRGESAQPYNARAIKTVGSREEIALEQLTASSEDLEKFRGLLADAAAQPSFARLAICGAEGNATGDADGNETVDIIAVTIQLDGEEVVVANARSTRERDELDRRLRMADRLSSLGTMAAGVAHEINNPVAYIAASLEYCLEEVEGDPDRVEEADALRTALRGTSRVARIVRDLGAFAHFEESHQDAQGEVAKALELTMNIAHSTVRHQAEMVTSISEDLPLVKCDSGQLAQVLLNLVINAADAMPPTRSATTNRIEITAVRTEGGVEIAVEDNGVGMDSEAVHRAFDPFFTTKEVGSGTGLGLSISHTIVENAGGKISVTSTPGEGTRFVVELPAAAEKVEHEERVAVSEIAKGLSILLIDDDRGIRRAMMRLLGREFEMTQAESAEEACSLVREQGFDVILCDVMMPGMNGVEFHRWLQREEPAMAGRLIFFTGGAVGGPIRDDLDKSRAPVLAKPFELDHFRQVLASAPFSGSASA